MSDTSQGDGWWEASDGKWYPPESHPDNHLPPPPPQDSAAEINSAALQHEQEPRSVRTSPRLLFAVALLLAIAFVLVMVALVLQVSGDDTASESVSESVATTTSSVPLADRLSDEDLFILFVRTQLDGSYFDEVPDRSLIEVVESTCGALDEGASARDVLSVIQDNVPAADQITVAEMLGAGVAAFCPEHSDKFEDV